MPVVSTVSSIEIAYPASTAMEIDLASDGSTVDEWTSDGSTHTTTVEADTDYELIADSAKVATFSVDSAGAASLKVAHRSLAIAQPLTASSVQSATASVITVPVNKTINASEATPTEGITYTFDFVADAADEVGEYDVPAGVDIPTITLTAAAMSGDTQSLSDVAALPDASAFEHAGKYTFKMSEVSSATSNWNNDDTEYEINVFVVNGADGLEYDATTPYAIKVNGEKTSSCDFVNTYEALSDLSITQNTVGEFADKTALFPFSITVNIPDWCDTDTFSYNVAPTGGAGASLNDDVSVSNHSFTITTNLADSGSVSIHNLPVGSTYSVSETSSSQGAMTYVPTATFTYSSTSEAAGFATKTNNVAAGTGSITVSAEAEAANESTLVGDGSGNAVTVTNTYSDRPSMTGLVLSSAPYLAALACLAGIAALAFASRRREG